MSKPLMAKATAVWLVDNTTLSFAQIADFCGMHELEVQGIDKSEMELLLADLRRRGTATQTEVLKYQRPYPRPGDGEEVRQVKRAARHIMGSS